jgi:hypothetical protein
MAYLYLLMVVWWSSKFFGLLIHQRLGDYFISIFIFNTITRIRTIN